MKQEMMNVLVYIIKTRKLRNGECPVLLRVTIDGVYSDIRINRSVKEEIWDAKLGMCRGKSREANELNDYIRSLHTRLYEIHRNMVLQDEYFTPEILLKKLFNKETTKTVLTFFKEHNEDCRRRIGLDYAYSTINRYDNCYKSLQVVIEKEYGKSDITFTEFTSQLIRKYELYLTVDKGLSQNTLVRYMKVIKKVSTLALATGLLKNDPFAGMRFKQAKTNPVFLTKEELDIITTKEFTLPRIALVRDVFVFCCYTGLAFVDVSNLKKEHIVLDNEGTYWIRKSREKTENMCDIPLLDIPLEIIRRYENHRMCKSKGILLPVMCNQKMNSYLKEITDFCGIDKDVTTHTARHTFATTVTLANGVALTNVAKMLGHTSTRMTEHYAKVLNHNIYSDMKKVQSKMSMSDTL
ncbi:site-specific integrase [Bacteroides sp. 519]|uniref:site-specific integrase n=1 Tax=Bacteroides sp. 519 TaxID=2302937 RepID=UPI0013D102DF|nr:site-specific integrase [Bacteroides sp. 519]MDL2245662.1 site-specific integrase [Parabacteroides sp. OttesenSCG-928-J18]NDV58157.1 site-specific integrase [Bacteroides sp. 519]